MRRVAAILAAVMTIGAASAWAGDHAMRHRGGSDVKTCQDMNVQFGDSETYEGQESFTIPAGPLDVSAAKSGGVSLIRGDSNQYEVQLCKFAEADSKSEGDRLLSQIVAERGSGKLSVRGPEGEKEWTASLIIRVPANSTVNVSATNGPLAAREVSGTFTLDTVNGPIAVRNVSGKVNAKAKNGPISFVGDGGDLSLDAQNGPIAIELKSQAWSGGKLDANAKNGPISLNIPKGYQSGVVLTAKGYSPMSCRADVCSEARKTWDDNEKKIEFGPAGNQVIHISAANGPVSVGSRSEGEL
ncbi:MAG TPA: hypothetical protein VN577_18225 [Terriglobales bacterium]|nr:hypothetical protein [Terriglobales bacterium]